MDSILAPLAEPYVPVPAFVNNTNGTAPTSSTIQPYNIANYVIAVLWVLVIGWALTNLISHLRVRLLIDAPKLLFGHVVAVAIVRLAFMFVPASAWSTLRKTKPALQVFLDVLPEFLFLCIFSLLIAMWTNVFARSKYLKIRRPENILWITHGILCALLLIGAGILCLVVFLDYSKTGVNLYTASYRHWESYYILASAVVVLLGTIIFGIGVARSLSQMQLISDFLKRQATRVRLLIFITFCAILVKVVYNLVVGKVVNQAVFDGRLSTKANAAISFFYFFLTELVPVSAILVVFINPSKTKKTASGREYVPYSEADVSSSDGLLSNDEQY